jgi:transposase InsO family protein
MWTHLQRLGVPVARCTMERLMREHGWRSVTPARTVRTTVADPAAARAPDLVKWQFTAARPDQRWVADFTYVSMTVGFGYTAFVIDAFAGLIVGWEGSLSKHTAFVESKHTAFVESAIRQAVAFRSRQGHPLTGGTIHHSDAGSQYTAVRFGKTLMLAELIPSIGTVGDALGAMRASFARANVLGCARGIALRNIFPAGTSSVAANCAFIPAGAVAVA